MTKEKNIIEYFKTIKYRFQERKRKKEEFPYYGLDVLMGGQGSGKTISAVKMIKKRLKEYPKAIFITNTKIEGIENETYYYENTSELVKLMSEKIDPKSRCGYIIFIDEIHVVLSELFGKSDPIFLTYLSQQRKCGINIIGTSQLYNKCPKVVRDYLLQTGQIIFCENHFFIQINKFVKMEDAEETSNLKLKCTIKKFDWFFHTVELYNSYETFAVISQIKGLFKEMK